MRTFAARRAVTGLYNRQLRSEGVEITQFTLLMALDRTGEITQGKLGRVSALDSTTLTMMEPLGKRGWIQEKEGDDRRFRIIRLTGAGRGKLRQSLPRWKVAQDRDYVAAHYVQCLFVTNFTRCESRISRIFRAISLRV